MSSINTEDEPQLDDNFRPNLRQGVRPLQTGTYVIASEHLPQPPRCHGITQSARCVPGLCTSVRGHTTMRNSSRVYIPMAPVV